MLCCPGILLRLWCVCAHALAQLATAWLPVTWPVTRPEHNAVPLCPPLTRAGYVYLGSRGAAAGAPGRGQQPGGMQRMLGGMAGGGQGGGQGAGGGSGGTSSGFTIHHGGQGRPHAGGQQPPSGSGGGAFQGRSYKLGG